MKKAVVITRHGKPSRFDFRLLNDPRFADCAFIAETPVDEAGDEERNVRVLKSLVEATQV